MRQFNSLCLAGGRNVLTGAVSSFGVHHVLTRYSSLSAIHRGLRNSEKARPQGFEAHDLNAEDSGRAPRSRPSTSRDRRDLDWEAPSFKIKKGKKYITDKGPQPKSRSGRFNDPTEPFGKKSLVYQLKKTDLREKLAALVPGQNSAKKAGSSRVGREGYSDQTRERRSESKTFEGKFESKFSEGIERKRDFRSEDRPSRGRGGYDRSGDRNDSRFEAIPSRRRGGHDIFEGRNSRSDSRPHERPGGSERFEERRVSRFVDKTFRGVERSERLRDRPGGPGATRARGAFESRDERSDFTKSMGDRDSRGELRPQTDRGASRSLELPSRESPSALEKSENSPIRRVTPYDDMPIRIHHTTAASQFLYGRSVVEAALKDSRRQLYHLYIYNGEDRKNLSQDAHLENLSKRKDVKTTKITDRDGLRTMDKMSGGRPHNGCVLEASPLPQLPVKGLGQMSEDPKKPGFSLELAYQSSEETAINGTSDFVSYRARGGQKPFILLLHGILDPGNLGAILRTAAFLGVTGVAITRHSTATLTPVALKASAGAAEVVPIYTVNSTSDFLERSKEAGWMTYAAVPSGPRSRGNSHVTLERVESYDPLSSQPTILVVGSEGEGLAKNITRIADFEVSIPSYSGLMSVVDSLNVSVATGILCSAFLKKQRTFEIDGLAEVKQEEGDEKLW